MQAKNVPINGFKLREALGEDELAKHMSMLARSSKAILTGRPVASHSEIYRTCDLVCKYGHAKQLYSAIHSECVVYCRTELKQIWHSVATMEDIVARWSEFEQGIRVLQDVLAIMDRVYSRKETGLLKISSVLLGSFRTVIWQTEKDKLLKVGLAYMDKCREAYSQDAILTMRAFWGILEKLEVFLGADVMSGMVDRTAKFFNSMFVNASRHNMKALLPTVRDAITRDTTFIRASFPESIQSQLIMVVKKALIQDRLSQYTGSILSESLFENYENCTLLYYLLSLTDSLPQLATALTLHVKAATVTCMARQSIGHLIEFKDMLDSLIVAGFNNDVLFVAACKEGIECAINQKTASMSNLISKHLDQLLTTPVTDTDELKGSISKTMVFFRLLQGKEIFESHYKQYLATRLLEKSTCGMEFEQFVINTIKEECGASFTSRMEGMFRDISSSRDATASFHKTSGYRSRPHSNTFTASVITNGIWPSTESLDLYLPESVVDDCQRFEQHYLKFAKKRKLAWEHAYGECVIRASFDAGSVDLEMPVFCAAVLLQFGSCDELAVSDLQKLSKLPDKWFQHALRSLTENNLLTSNNNMICYNRPAKNLADKVTIRTSMMVPDTNPDDITTLKEQDKDERAYRLDAAIVRFLKKKTKVSLPELQKEVGELDILEDRLRSLTEREFCKPSPEESTYLYLP